MTQVPTHDETTAAARREAFDRRRFLRGAGALLALPALESVAGRSVLAAAAKEAAKAATPSGAPMRLAFVYFPNGAIPSAWWPEGKGDDFAFGKTLKPLEPLRDRLQVMAGLDHVNATPGPDGAGDHARAGGTFLTGVRVRKTAGSNIHAGVSIDQVIARQVGHLTRFPSLELSCDPVRRSGNCDSGYSCAYQFNLSWRSPTTPVPPEPNPRLVFERLFGSGSHGQRRDSLKRRQAEQRSILDFVMEDARALSRGVSTNDRRKLDEYLGSVREIETRIEKAERMVDQTPDPDADTPPGIPSSYEDYLQVMYDLMLLAFQTDSTRVASFITAHDGSNRAFPEIGIVEGHHYLTHHRNQQDMVDKVAEIDRFYITQFAKFLTKLANTKDLDGRSLLDNSMIVYGSGNADGNRHTHVNLPVLLAGGGGGTLTPGRFVQAGSVPMSNLFLSLADRMGASDLTRFGDSTGRYDSI